MRYCKLFLIFAVIACLTDLSALRIVPFVYSFDPEEKNVFQYYVENKSDQFIAFEVRVWKRNVDDSLTEDDDSFSIYPSQLIIPPHTQRTVKVKWNGNSDFTKNKMSEQSFRVLFEQFPVDLTNNKHARISKEADIKIKLNIYTSLYVTPKNSRGKLKLISVDGNSIKLKNIGTRRVSLSDNDVDITIGGKKLKDLLEEADKEIAIISGAEKVIKLKSQKVNAHPSTKKHNAKTAVPAT